MGTFLNDTLPCYVLIMILSIPYILLELVQLTYCTPIKYKTQKTYFYLTYLITQKCSLSSKLFITGLIVTITMFALYIFLWILLLYLYSKRKRLNLFDLLTTNLLSGFRKGKGIFELIFLLKHILIVLLICFNIYYGLYYIVFLTLILITFAILEILSNPYDKRSIIKKLNTF